MEPIYKVNAYDLGDNKPYLIQMERHGQTDRLFILRWTNVSAVNLATARAIQRDYRQNR